MKPAPTSDWKKTLSTSVVRLAQRFPDYVHEGQKAGEGLSVSRWGGANWIIRKVPAGDSALAEQLSGNNSTLYLRNPDNDFCHLGVSVEPLDGERSIGTIDSVHLRGASSNVYGHL